MNNYLSDSGFFFKEVSRRIENVISDNELIQLSFNLALGCERLLKGILYDLNPLYILLEPDFKHSLKTVYSSKIISEVFNSKELATNPNADVISFSNSLLKAQFVSKTVHSHKNVLFVISNSRDIIAHCELNLFNKEKMREILQRDYYMMLKSFSTELGIEQSHFFDDNHIKLSRISGLNQTDLAKKIELMFDEHREKWLLVKEDLKFIEDKKHITCSIYETGNKDRIKCPSCQNEALIYLTPITEYDFYKAQKQIIGYQVKKLECQYCNLEIKDPAMLDNLGITDRKIH
ncbi:MAG TPA: hypothetical protein VF455_12200, partial [Chryseobacterium sp.]